MHDSGNHDDIVYLETPRNKKLGSRLIQQITPREVYFNHGLASCTHIHNKKGFSTTN